MNDLQLHMFALLSNKTTDDVSELLEKNQYTNLQPFVQCVEWLYETKYKNNLHVYFEDDHIFCSICCKKGEDGPNLVLGLANAHDEDISTSPVYINGRIAFEHYSLFDKWSKVPYPIFLPQSKDVFDQIFKFIEYVDSQTYVDEDLKYWESDAEDYGDETYNAFIKLLEDHIDWSSFELEFIPDHLKEKYKDN